MSRTDLACELSWSASRAAEHRRCPREAWFARYRSWGWWRERPRGPRWRALVHKHLSPLAAFAGDCVHRALARWFDARRAGGFLGRSRARGPTRSATCWSAARAPSTSCRS